MAVAASQMYNLGHGEMEALTWESRGLALSTLRNHLRGSQQTPEETIIATVMMSFLEVSDAVTSPRAISSF